MELSIKKGLDKLKGWAFQISKRIPIGNPDFLNYSIESQINNFDLIDGELGFPAFKAASTGLKNGKSAPSPFYIRKG